MPTNELTQDLSTNELHIIIIHELQKSCPFNDNPTNSLKKFFDILNLRHETQQQKFTLDTLGMHYN